MTADFGPRNFDVRIFGLGANGERNYRLRVPETYDTLEPAKCTLKIKPDKIVLNLKTGTPIVPFGSWSRLAKG